MENFTNSNEENTNNSANDQTPETPEVKLNEGKLAKYLETLKEEQDWMMGFTGGLGAAVLGGIVWAVVTVLTGYQIGYMAIGVGFIVGIAVRMFGKGLDQGFGLMGGVLALLGCLIGNFLSLIGFASKSEGVGYFDLLTSIDYSLVPEIMIETFSPMDLLFYGIAVYEGYKFSFRQVTEEEIIANAVD